jgi:hypothetical protein
MGIRYRVLQAAFAFLVALGFVALGGTWAWAQQAESGLAAQQGGECPGAEEISAVGPDDRDLLVGPFDVDGNNFRITYKTTDLDENGVPFLDVTILDEDDDEVNVRVIREQGTETEIVNRGPGRFSMEIRAEDLTYEITVEDCTGDDGSGGGDGSNDRDRNNNRDGSNGNNRSGLDRSAAEGQYGRSLDADDGLDLGESPGFGIGQDANIPDDVIADTVPDRKLPFTGGPPLLGLAFIGLACAGLLGLAVLRSAIRRS